jgi:hypothetical protein
MFIEFVLRFLCTIFVAYLSISFLNWDFTIENWNAARLVAVVCFFGTLLSMREKDDQE